MKKLFTLSLGLALSVSLNAESVKILSLGMGIPGIDETQLMGLSISPNGKYACGSIENGDGYFIGDLETNDFKFEVTEDPEGAELRHVDNNGLAIGYNGPGVTYSINGVETVLVTPEGNYRYVLGEALSNDGSIMVGSLVLKGYQTLAAYSKNGGEWTQLPMPADEELGEYAGEGSSAKYVSGDGKKILGCIGNFGPAILWKMNDEGEYEIDPLFNKYVVMSEDEAETSDKELYALSSMGLSNNGKYALFRGMIMREEGFVFVPAVYDVESQSITIYDENQEIDQYGVGLTPSAIADNGTFIGIIGQPFYGCMGSFIMIAGETQAIPFTEAFPAYAETFGFPDMIGFCTPTGIFADGRYIIGYGYYSDDFEDEELPAYFVTFVIDREDTTGIDVSNSIEVQAVPEAYYTIDGKQLNGMTKGINIVRMSDGTVRKVINR